MIKCTTVALFLHRTVRMDNPAVRTVRCKNSATVVHFITGYYSDPGSDTLPRIQFSHRTSQQTQRFEPATAVSKRKKGSSVRAVATVVSNNIISYFGISQRLFRKISQFSSEALTGCIEPHKAGVGTLWPNLNRLIRLVPCGEGILLLQ